LVELHHRILDSIDRYNSVTYSINVFIEYFFFLSFWSAVKIFSWNLPAPSTIEDNDVIILTFRNDRISWKEHNKVGIRFVLKCNERWSGSKNYSINLTYPTELNRLNRFNRHMDFSLFRVFCYLRTSWPIQIGQQIKHLRSVYSKNADENTILQPLTFFNERIVRNTNKKNRYLSITKKQFFVALHVLENSVLSSFRAFWLFVKGHFKDTNA